MGMMWELEGKLFVRILGRKRRFRCKKFDVEREEAFEVAVVAAVTAAVNASLAWPAATKRETSSSSEEEIPENPSSSSLEPILTFCCLFVSSF